MFFKNVSETEYYLNLNGNFSWFISPLPVNSTDHHHTGSIGHRSEGKHCGNLKCASFCPLRPGCKVSYNLRNIPCLAKLGLQCVRVTYQNKTKSTEQMACRIDPNTGKGEQSLLTENHENTWTGEVSTGKLEVKGKE